jgi:multidrug efflux pump
MYDSASTIMEQKLSQIQGVGQVSVGGASYPAVRVDVNPPQLNHYGITIATIQRLLGLQNSDIARGQISNNLVTADIITNDQISKAAQYRPLIVGYHNGLAVHLSDVANVQDSAQSIRTPTLSRPTTASAPSFRSWKR